MQIMNRTPPAVSPRQPSPTQPASQPYAIVPIIGQAAVRGRVRGYDGVEGSRLGGLGLPSAG